MHLPATLETCVKAISGHLTVCRTDQLLTLLRMLIETVLRNRRANPFSLSFWEEDPLRFPGILAPRTNQNKDLTVAVREPVRPEPRWLVCCRARTKSALHAMRKRGLCLSHVDTDYCAKSFVEVFAGSCL